MSFKGELEKKIEKKREEIAALERSLVVAQSYLQALQDTLKLIPKEPGDHSAQQLREGSDMAKARDLICEAGRPLHISELLKGLKKEETKEARLSLSGSLSGYVRQGRVFTRPSPNTFGIIGQTVPKEGPGPAAEPPESFGKEVAVTGL
jgi:hypothetical protein